MAGTFEIDLRNFAAKVGARVEVVVRKVAIDLFSRIILRSPVDTGRFRANWQIAIGSIPSGTLELKDKTGQATISKVTAKALHLKAGDTITLVNNLPYAGVLEYGHSQQAPAGMVRISIAEFQQMIDQAVRKT
jgi:hypothetical protein